MKKWLVVFTGTLAVILVVTGVFPHGAKAAFIANNLIDDGLFDNSGSMNAAQIDAFLNNNFPNSCISTKNGFTTPDPNGYSHATGFTYGGNVSAGQAIYDVTQVYGLNPQVILATLEKESSVVSGNASYRCQYMNTAMGYDCPDSGSCPQFPATESGFSKQITWATWVLKFSQQHALGNYNWAVVKPNWDNSDDLNSCRYGGPMTGGTYKRCTSSTPTFYDGYTVIDGTSVHLDTGATAALYSYTPHFHGNQLFVNYFESWFGSTTGEGYVLASSYMDNGDQRQWVVYRGVKHVVTDVNMLKAWGLDKVTLLQWPGTYLGSFSTGSNMTRLFRPSGSGDVYFADGGNCFRVTSGGMMATWNFNAASIMDVPIFLGRVPTNRGNLTYSVTNTGGTSTYYVDGGSLRSFSNSTVQAAWEGAGSPHQVISDVYLSQMGSGSSIIGPYFQYNGNYYMMYKGQAYITTDRNIAESWGLLAAPGLSAPFSFEYRPPGMMTRFVRSAVPNDYRLFIVDRGRLYYLTQAHAANLGITGAQPMMPVVPEDITPSITAWSGIIIADNGGKEYVIDNGTKRPFPNLAVQNYWNGNNPASAPVMTNGFLNLLPTGSPIERGLVGGAAPQYTVDSFVKHWITSPSTVSLYAPIVKASDNLINVLPSGTNY